MLVRGVREQGGIWSDHPPFLDPAAHGDPGHMLHPTHQDNVREAHGYLHEPYMNGGHGRATLLVNKFSGNGLW